MPSRNRGAQDPRWQRWLPQPKPLASIAASSSTVVAVPFSVPIPDSRFRVKVSLLFALNSNSIGDAAPAATLWLYEADDNDYGGVMGEVPLVNLVGTKAVPVSIPLAGDVNLYGWSREFVTAADYINGILTVQGNGGTVGTWVLQARYQPNAVSLAPDEWDLITSQCNPAGVFINVP